MIRRFPSPRLSTGRTGFTLVELLTVVAIILVLAGLLIGVAGNASYKSSFARAQTEVKAMETALESYKADNGAYPRPATVGSSSDALNAQSDNDPGGGNATYAAAGKLLYQALSGVPATGTTYGKKYMDFKPGQLNDVAGTGLTATTTPGPNTLVVDPFGIPYGYSTRGAYAAEQVQAGTLPAANASTYGYNPTFDLWSTGGYGSGGRQYAKTNLPAASYNTLWAKNW